ncbi:MAG: acyltransferase [Actinomycetota bacterium]|nr:acyltransferase [Actinomycetota bacterium]
MTEQPDALVSRSKNMGYLAGVDHLRGYAAVLMVVYHGVQQVSNRVFPRVHDPLSALVVEGHTAVALFMVLSGFILTYGVGERPIRYGGFMKNRVLRVVPMYVVVVVVGMYTFSGAYSLSGVFQYFTLQATPPLPMASFGPWSAVLWTISVEFSLYLLFPFLVRFLQREGVRYLVGLLLLTNVLRLLSAATNRAAIRDLSYWTIVGRIDQFVLGMIAAWLIKRGMLRLAGTQAVLLALAAFAGVCCALWWFNANGSFYGNAVWKAQWPLVEGALWALFVAGYVLASRGWTGRVKHWLTLPGIVSYSAYLLHFVLVSVVADRMWNVLDGSVANAALLTVVVILPATFALSTLCYLVVERPFMQMRVRYVATPEPAAAT